MKLHLLIGVLSLAIVWCKTVHNIASVHIVNNISITSDLNNDDIFDLVIDLYKTELGEEMNTRISHTKKLKSVYLVSE